MHSHLLCSLLLSSLPLYTRAQSSLVEVFGSSLVAACFRDSESGLTQSEAGQYCLDRYGTNLAKIDSEDRWSEAQSLVDSTADDCTSATWIGLEYDSEDQQWQWADEESVSLDRWEEGYPSEMNSQSTERCVQMQQPEEYDWVNRGCDERISQILCESNPVRRASSQFHTAVQVRTTMNWTESNHFCQEYFGTNLGGWHSESEVSALQSAMEDSDIWSDSGYTNLFWGINMLNQQNWTNADGTRSDFLRWYANEPWSGSNPCTTLFYSPIDQPDQHMNHRTYYCNRAGVTSLVCNNENLQWDKKQQSIIVEAPLTNGSAYFGTDFRSSLQNSWSARQASSYCDRRFGESLVYLANNQSVQRLKDYALRALKKGKGQSREGMDSDTILPMWIGLEYSVESGGFEWMRLNESSVVLSAELASDDFWIGGFNESLSMAEDSEGDTQCVFMDVNPNSDTLGMFDLGSCQSDSFDLFACDSEAYDYSALLRAKYYVVPLNADSEFGSRRHFYWVSVVERESNAYTFIGQSDANLLCRDNFGTSLASIHSGSAYRIVNRAFGNSSLGFAEGWMGLIQHSYKQWIWANGNPWAGFHHFGKYNKPYASASEVCGYFRTSKASYEPGFGITWCGFTWRNFLCSTVREKWSDRVSKDEEREAMLQAEYQSDIDQSRYGLIIPPFELLPRFALIRPTTGFTLNHRGYQKWCQKRYNRDGAVVKRAEDVRELQQLLIDENLLFSNLSGSGIIVMIGAEFDAQIGEWRWYDGSKVRWNKLERMGVKVDWDRLKDKKQQCLAIDTASNQFMSVHCRKFDGSAWLCKTPRLDRFGKIVRSPLRGVFCVAPWLFALLSVPVIVLNVFVHWWVLRLIQYETYLTYGNESELRLLFEKPNSTLQNQLESGLTQNEVFFRDRVDHFLRKRFQVPSEVCSLIHEYSGKPTIHAYVSSQFHRWKWVIKFVRHGWLPWIMIVRLSFVVLSFLLILVLTGIWADQRHGSWIQWGGFWIALVSNPTIIKFAASNRVISKTAELHEYALGQFEPYHKKKCYDGKSLSEANSITLLAAQVVVFVLTACVYTIAPIAGLCLYPWCSLAFLSALFFFLAKTEDECCDCFKMRGVIDKWEVQTKQLQRMNARSLCNSVLRLTVMVMWICLVWLVIVTSGIAFWTMCMGRPWLDSYSYAWDNPYCDSHFDFDPFDYRAWVLLLHWLLF